MLVPTQSASESLEYITFYSSHYTSLVPLFFIGPIILYCSHYTSLVPLYFIGSIKLLSHYTLLVPLHFIGHIILYWSHYTLLVPSHNNNTPLYITIQSIKVPVSLTMMNVNLIIVTCEPVACLVPFLSPTTPSPPPPGSTQSHSLLFIMTCVPT